MSAAPAQFVPLPVDWRAGLRRSGKVIVGDENNTLAALRTCPDLAGLWQFNEFRGRTEVTRSPPWRQATAGSEWTDHDDYDLQGFLQGHEIAVRQRRTVADGVERVARDKIVHPVRDYLSQLKFDGKPRIANWLTTYLRAEGPPDYLSAIGRKVLVQAVARAMRPGCQADATLVLSGGQGFGKSSTVRILGRQWSSESAPHDLASKDAVLSLYGTWIVELPELAALRRSQIETWKAFLTRRTDRVRPPFGRRDIELQRTAVFIATTNEASFLRDPTGNRRFWPVKCQRIDLPALERDVDQLWAEAVRAYRAGEPWHLSAPEEALAVTEQHAHELVTELERVVFEYLDGLAARGQQEVEMRRVLVNALHLDDTAPDYVERAGRLGPQAAAAMERAGWVRVKAVGRGASRRVIYRNSQGVIG